MNDAPITDADLHAWVDGQLPADRATAVEAYLADHPAEAARLAAYGAQNAGIRRLFDPVLDAPIPSRLVMAPRAQQRRPWQAMAAGLALAIASGAAGWGLHDVAGGERDAGQSMLPPQALAHQAAIAHAVYSPDLRRPVEIGAAQEEQLVAWLSKRIGSRIRPPHLGKLGYELIGGRLLPGASGPVAQFMYHDRAGQRLTLYVSTGQARNKDTGFRFKQEGPVNVFYWIDGQFGYALSAGVDKGELARVAAAVYGQLDEPA